ncbi:hypothetical protein N9Y42_02050 [Mariniblastus sp.]|nr:hypothetical protein [Mariniblastus sp.]
MGGPYAMEYLLAIGFVFLGLLLVCVPRPRKAHLMTDEEYAKQQARRRKKQAFAAKKRGSDGQKPAMQIKIKPKVK